MSFFQKFLSETHQDKTTADDIRWENQFHNTATWEAISLLGGINGVFGFLLLWIIYSLGVKLNGFLKLVVIMTIYQIIKDFSWLFAYWPTYSFSHIFEIIYAFGSIAASAYSNVIMLWVVYVIRCQRYVDIGKYFSHISGVIFSISVVLAFVVIPIFGRRCFGNPIVCTHEGWYFLSYFQFGQIFINIIGVGYIFRTVKYLTGHEELKKTLKMLAYKIVFYPVVQILTTVVYQFIFLLWGVIDQKIGNGLFLFASIVYPCAGLGNLIVFLIVQKKAFEVLACQSSCGRRLPSSEPHSADAANDDEDLLMREYVRWSVTSLWNNFVSDSTNNPTPSANRSLGVGTLGRDAKVNPEADTALGAGTGATGATAAEGLERRSTVSSQEQSNGDVEEGGQPSADVDVVRPFDESCRAGGVQGDSKFLFEKRISFGVTKTFTDNVGTIEFLVNDSIGIGYLLAFCKTQYCVENISFVLEVQQYRDMFPVPSRPRGFWKNLDSEGDLSNLVLESKIWPDLASSVRWPTTDNCDEIEAKVRHIWSTFLIPSAEMEICVAVKTYDNTVRRLQRIQAYGPELFEQAMIDPINVMQRDMLPRFLVCEYFRDMKRHLTELKRLPGPADLSVPPPSESLLFENLRSSISEQEITSVLENLVIGDVLSNKIVYTKFLQYLQSTMSSENLLCARSIQVFREKMRHILHNASTRELCLDGPVSEQAWMIFKFFVCQGSCFEVSLSHRRRHEVMNTLASPTMSMFDKVEKSALSALAHHLTAFKRSPQWVSELRGAVAEFQANQAASSKQQTSWLGFGC